MKFDVAVKNSISDFMCNCNKLIEKLGHKTAKIKTIDQFV